MNKSQYKKFAKDNLGVEFEDIDLLVSAFTHRSFVNENRKVVEEHNERLEFLGDAVLELIVTEYLYLNFKEPEGILTNWRSSMVRTESISQAASKFGFEPLLLLSKGEKRGTKRARAQILANSFEAVIGAIYIDQGYEEAKKFITKSILSTFKEILATGSWMDPKSYLQELAQSQESHTPQYKVMEEEGPDHDKTFTVGVYVAGKLKGQGVGPNKQTAQQNAARAALKFYEHKHGSK
ncbi:MAG TPA: ribonuclease III [Candidatus Sulfotelmatobacter sp.]|nr:ribonuclease III [Candidatus Sulfotelmatobacter sp.]